MYTARISQNSSIPYETRNPISEVRKEYWIPRGKSYIKRILYHYIICRHLNSRPYNYPKSPNLPLSRVDDSYQFICTGMDYTGAVYCRSIYNDDVLNRDPFKCYIVIYTRPSIRGLIPAVVPDVSAEIFINSLKKFISRRGCPAKILWDNRGVFVAELPKNLFLFVM